MDDNLISTALQFHFTRSRSLKSCAISVCVWKHVFLIMILALFLFYLTQFFLTYHTCFISPCHSLRLYDLSFSTFHSLLAWHRLRSISVNHQMQNTLNCIRFRENYFIFYKYIKQAPNKRILEWWRWVIKGVRAIRMGDCMCVCVCLSECENDKWDYTLANPSHQSVHSVAHVGRTQSYIHFANAMSYSRHLKTIHLNLLSWQFSTTLLLLG